MLYAPWYLEARLKETLTFNVSWNQDAPTTLTIVQFVGPQETQVLYTNGSIAEFLNNWASKGTAEFTNATEEMIMTLTLTGVVLEDEGHYQIQVRPEISMEENLLSTLDFYIQTYGKFKENHHASYIGAMSKHV